MYQLKKMLNDLQTELLIAVLINQSDNLFILLLTLGPIASMLTNKFGCRIVTIVGTIIAASGFILSIFAPNIYFMYFSFGIVAGECSLLI